MNSNVGLLCGGGVWALALKSAGPWFKSSTLPLTGFVLGTELFDRAVQIVNRSASHQFGFFIVYVLFEIFVYIFTVTSISVTVLNTFDT